MAPNIKIAIKHNQKVYRDVEVDLEEPVSVLRVQIWTLTGVPPERQKILIKGLLKDDDSLLNVGLRNGDKVMLVGTAEGTEVPERTEKPVFFEDLSAEQKRLLLQEKKIEILPAGMKNLGNTCFLNSVLQILKPAKAFNSAVKNINAFDPMLPPLLRSMRKFYNQWETATEPLVPYELVSDFRNAFPQLGTRGRFGYQQQDAEQCLTALLNYMKGPIASDSIHSWFEITAESRLKCIDNEAEEAAISTEQFLVLPCHLGSAQSSVYTLYEGIKLSMEEIIEKKSHTLDANAKYKKQLRITELPEYLLVHLVRFEWKENAMEDGKGTRAKICRKIDVASTLDVYDFCSEKLQKELAISRKVHMIRKDRELEGGRGDAPFAASASTETLPTSETSLPEASTQKPQLLLEGKYELTSIVTHKGRDGESGHYVAWVKKTDDEWFKFDDADVSVHKWVSLNLYGGCSDYHIAYICMYKRRMMEVTEEELLQANSTT